MNRPKNLGAALRRVTSGVSKSKLLLMFQPTGRRRLGLPQHRQLKTSFGVDRAPMLQFLRQLTLGVDCVHWTLSGAHAAIDALFGIDVHHLPVPVETVDRTHGNAIGEAAAAAIVGDNVGHGEQPDGGKIREIQGLAAKPAFGKPSAHPMVNGAEYAQSRGTCGSTQAFADCRACPALMRSHPTDSGP